MDHATRRPSGGLARTLSILALAVASLPALAQSRPAKPAAKPLPTAFDGQVSGRHAERIKRAVVSVALLENGEETVAAATGALIADSGVPDPTFPGGAGPKQILTASHLGGFAPEELRAARFVVRASTGQKIGEAAFVVAAPHLQSSADAIHENSDVAVLRFYKLAPGGKQVLDGIQGLEIGPQAATPLTGLIGQPAGLDGGASGSPVVDRRTGKLVGVFSAYAANDALPEVAVRAPTITDMANDLATGRRRDPATSRDTYAPTLVAPAGRAFAMTLTPRILDVLGPAGQHVPVAGKGVVPVVIPGFPDYAAVAYTGRMAPFDVANPGSYDLVTPAGKKLPPSGKPYWDDSEQGMMRASDLLLRAAIALPNDKDIAGTINALQLTTRLSQLVFSKRQEPGFGDVKPGRDYGTSENLVEVMREAAAKVKDPALAADLREAATYLPQAVASATYQDQRAADAAAARKSQVPKAVKPTGP